MAKKIKFALKMKDGAEVRTLQELKDGFDLNAVMAYFLDGKLEVWLSDRYYDDLADSIQELDKDDPELGKKLCGIFGVEYKEDTMSIEEIEERNRRISRLMEITDDESIIEHVDSVAFSQEELADLLDEGKETIYLCGTDFRVPVRKKNITYIGVNTTLTLSDEECQKYAKSNIEFINLLSGRNDADKEVTHKRMKEIDFNQAFFKCRKHYVENCIAYAVPELEEYKTPKNAENNGDEDETEAQFHSGLIKIDNPEISRYLDVVYDGKQLIYIAEDGQGIQLASMGRNGKNIQVIRRWDENEGKELKEYFLGRKYAYVAYTVEDEESEYGYLVERISADGEVIGLDDNLFLTEWKNHIEMEKGLYSISFEYDWEDEDGGWLNVKCILYTEKKVKDYKIKIKNVGEGSRLTSWNVYDKDIFFFLYDSDSDKGRFYCFNAETRKVKLACKTYIDDEIGAFCVNQDGVYFDIYEGEDYEDKNLEFLNVKTGKMVTLWYNIGSLEEIRIMGDYVYLLPGYYNRGNFLFVVPNIIGSEFCYRMKLDGTEKTRIEDFNEKTRIEKALIRKLC